MDSDLLSIDKDFLNIERENSIEKREREREREREME
jgi:hypothetical protein